MFVSFIRIPTTSKIFHAGGTPFYQEFPVKCASNASLFKIYRPGQRTVYISCVFSCIFARLNPFPSFLRRQPRKRIVYEINAEETLFIHLSDKSLPPCSAFRDNRPFYILFTLLFRNPLVRVYFNYFWNNFPNVLRTTTSYISRGLLLLSCSLFNYFNGLILTVPVCSCFFFLLWKVRDYLSITCIVSFCSRRKNDLHFSLGHEDVCSCKFLVWESPNSLPFLSRLSLATPLRHILLFVSQQQNIVSQTCSPR